MTHMKTIFGIISLMIVSFSASAQDLYWTGAGNDAQFFNENNWAEVGTKTPPSAGTIDPGKPVNRKLTIDNYSIPISGSTPTAADLQLGTGSLTLRKCTLKLNNVPIGIDMSSTANALVIDSAIVYAQSLKNTTLSLSGTSKLYLLGNAFTDAATRINITSYDAWVFIPNLRADSVKAIYSNNFLINGSTPMSLVNVRFVQYYDGTAVTGLSTAYTPLRVFDNENASGTYADLKTSTIYSGTTIPNSLNDKISSFKLKKGYMACFAAEADGTSYSKVYIASESDLTINTLPLQLNNSISFIRVMPYAWVNKKGTGGSQRFGLNESWYYNWGATNPIDLYREFAPMTWGKTAIDAQTDINFFVNKSSITHVLSFNEADDCAGQSGQYGGLCQQDTAVKYHENLMKTGLRIASPACRENEELDWLKIFNTMAVSRAIRMDVVAIHWYDWSSNPTSTPNADPTQIFNRFKSAVAAAYNYYKMPIWITEFNANPARARSIQDKFLQLALPWLESTPYVERYCWFQPAGSGEYFDANNVITSTGLIYKNQKSTPSIPEGVVNQYGNNLQNVINTTGIVEQTIKNNQKLKVKYNAKAKSLAIACDEDTVVDLYSVQGVKVRSFQSNQTILTQNLPKGVYLVCSKGYVPGKIMIQ